MVRIEPDTQETGETRLKKRVEFRREEAAEAPATPTSEEATEVQESQDSFWKDMKNILKTIKASFTGIDVNTVGMDLDQKSNYYLKKCWHHMSRNQVEQARNTYDNLMDIYEEMEEGTLKNDLYNEVYEIYQRLREVQ